MAGKPNATVLRNKGVPVEVVVVQPDPDTDEPRRVELDGSPRIEQRWVRLDANAIADIEEEFGSLDDFEAAARTKPFATVRKSLGLIWGVPTRTAGLMMIDGNLNEYSSALGVGLAIANGVDPTRAGKLLEGNKTQVKQAQTERNAALDRELARMKADAEAAIETTGGESDSPGANGSEPGSALSAPSASSGA